MRIGFVATLLGSLLVGAGCEEPYQSPIDTMQCISGCSLGEPITGCEADSDCAGLGSQTVCARDGECLPADEVRHIVVLWTVDGMPASDASCTAFPDLDLTFSNSALADSGITWSPVPCNEGKFNIDKLPTVYDTAQLEADNESGDASGSGTFDGSGNVTLDIQ